MPRSYSSPIAVRPSCPGMAQMALATESDSRNFKKLDCSSRSEALVVRLSDRTAGQVGFARETVQESTFGRIESDPTGPPAFRDKAGFARETVRESTFDRSAKILERSDLVRLRAGSRPHRSHGAKVDREKRKAYGTWYSQAVTHPSTNQARRCLTSVIGREPVLST